MANAYDFAEINDELKDSINLDDLESKLYEDFDEELKTDEDLEKLEILKEYNAKIGNPEALGDVMKNAIWEQIQNQIGIQAGEDFIKENRNMTLDLRNSAHIQTTENFAEGKIATHNNKIDYQQRYDDWQANFQKDKKGNIITHDTRSGKQEATLVKGARAPFDEARPVGSVERGTDMDHTISAGEIIRDAEANAHLSKDEQIAFANSDANLNELDSNLNRSKGDKSMNEWLDNPNKNGQKPSEIFENLTEEKAKQLRKKDQEARKEYRKVKDEGEERSIKTGLQSQKEESFRIGKNAARAIILQLMADFLKEIIAKIVTWFKSKNKDLKSLIATLKDGIHSFVLNLKKELINVGNTLVTTITTAIVGPIIGTLKKIWIFLKQGWSSLKQAVNFLCSPEAKNKPFDIVMLEVGKIIMGALTAGGAIILGEVIEKGLMTIPVFNIQIPLLGSLSNIIGIFLGAVIAGVIGAIALNLIDKAIAKKQKLELQIQIARQSDVVLKGQTLKTWRKLESAYETVGKITEITAGSIKNSVQRERNSLNQVDDVLSELDAIIGK